MVMRPPCGRIKTGTVLGCIAFGFLLIATDWVLGRYAHGQTLALRKEEAEVRAKLRALQEETKQFKARRNDMDLSGTCAWPVQDCSFRRPCALASMGGPKRLYSIG